MNEVVSSRDASHEHQGEEYGDDQASLYDLLKPIFEQWKALLLAAFIGLLLGSIVWFFKGYQAELRARPVTQLDFVEWRRLSSGLPALADSRHALGVYAPGQEKFYDTISVSGWWAKNVTPEFKYSKNDLKELAAISKTDQEEGATRIERVVIRQKALNKEDAFEMAAATERFIREGGAFTLLKSLVTSHDLETARITSTLQAKTSREQLELSYLNKRADALEALRNKYPDDARTAVQSVLDPKDSSARYLPLSTQLVAVRTEINGVEESLSRSRDKLEEARVKRMFVDKATPLLKAAPDGFTLGKQLIEIEQGIRKNLDATNKAQMNAINAIAEELDAIVTRFNVLFEPNPPVVVNRSGPFLFAVIGVVGGLLAGIVSVFLIGACRRGRRANQYAS